MVVADTTNELFSEIADFIVRRTSEMAMNVMLVITQEDSLLERESLKMLMQKRQQFITAQSSDSVIVKEK